MELVCTHIMTQKLCMYWLDMLSWERIWLCAPSFLVIILYHCNLVQCLQFVKEERIILWVILWIRQLRVLRSDTGLLSFIQVSQCIPLWSLEFLFIHINFLSESISAYHSANFILSLDICRILNTCVYLAFLSNKRKWLIKSPCWLCMCVYVCTHICVFSHLYLLNHMIYLHEIW